MKTLMAAPMALHRSLEASFWKLKLVVGSWCLPLYLRCYPCHRSRGIAVPICLGTPVIILAAAVVVVNSSRGVSSSVPTFTFELPIVALVVWSAAVWWMLCRSIEIDGAYSGQMLRYSGCDCCWVDALPPFSVWADALPLYA